MAQERQGAHSQSGDTREELREDASRLKDSAQAQAKGEAESRKDEAARTARSASSAIDSAASELERDDNAPDWLGSAMRQAAQQIERAAGGLDNRGIDDIGRDVSRFARENPLAFLGASAAAGFAASRMLRAGAQRHEDVPLDSRSQDSASGGDARRSNDGANGSRRRDEGGLAGAPDTPLHPDGSPIDTPRRTHAGERTRGPSGLERQARDGWHDPQGGSR